MLLTCFIKKEMYNEFVYCSLQGCKRQCHRFGVINCDGSGRIAFHCPLNSFCGQLEQWKCFAQTFKFIRETCWKWFRKAGGIVQFLNNAFSVESRHSCDFLPACKWLVALKQVSYGEQVSQVPSFENICISVLRHPSVVCGGLICKPATYKAKHASNKGFPFQFPPEGGEAVRGECAYDHAAECCSDQRYSFTNLWGVHLGSIPELLIAQVSGRKRIRSSYLKGVA